MTMKRCTKCVLPENYPAITFNEKGVCNYCTTYKQRKYLGGEALKEQIDSFLKSKKHRNKDYDCVLALSGGRDSSYLLYYLVKVMNLRVFAYSADNGVIPEQTKLNMKKMVGLLGVKHVIQEHDYLKRCLKHHILSWMHRPSPATVGIFCVGCRLGMDIGIVNFAKKNNIPVIILGGCPFEGGAYKMKIMQINPNSTKSYSFILGYLSKIIREPRWVLNRTCLITQIKEYYYHYGQKIFNKSGLLLIRPFYTHIRWNENNVISIIKNELKWEKNPEVNSTWRGDCDLAILKSYLYKRTLGFNDQDDGLSCLIRDNQISREEALKRLHNEAEIAEKVIKEIFDKFGLSYSDLEIGLRKARENKY
jgi:hypothetical protein